MNYAQAQQALLGLRREHRRAVVGHEGARQGALLEGLAQAVGEHLGGLRQIPLCVATQPAAIIQDPEQERHGPPAIGKEHTPRGVMKIQMPERVDIVALIAANLPGFKALLGDSRSRTVNRTPPGTFEEALTLEEAPQGPVGGHRPQKRILLYEHGEVVGVKLIAPTRMLMKLEEQWLAQLRRHGRMLAAIRTGLAPEGAHRVAGLP